MPNKRTYTLSDAARTQRRLASQAAKNKRAIAAYVAICRTQETESLRRAEPYVDCLAMGIDPAMFPPLPKDAPNSEHQSRAARIRVHMLKTGAISGSARGGRRHVARPCPRCNVECSTAREARDHCRIARAK